MQPLWALGLMSGTSADGVDGALIQTDGLNITQFGPTHYSPYPADLKSQILKAYGRPPGLDAIPLAEAITYHHAEVVFELLKKTPHKIDIIGFHGQTLFHNPPKTYQIGDGQMLANLTSIPVVEQFRLKDVEKGGQGAPLVPVFHQALAKPYKKPLGVLNIGGVANVTWIGSGEEDILAFDIGPGNGLIDDWIRENTSLPFDKGGEIASCGTIDTTLTKYWLSHPFFAQKPPKSLDRKTFQSCIEDVRALSFEDGVATLTAFTAGSFEKALPYLPQQPHQWLVAGGGSHNSTLLSMMQQKTSGVIKKASEEGWNSDALEAQAFGFLAVRCLRELPISFPTTTGVPYPLTGGRVIHPMVG